MSVVDKEANQRRQERDQCRGKICGRLHSGCYCPDLDISNGGKAIFHFSCVLEGIGAYPSTLVASGSARSLESPQRRLMPVMSHHNPAKHRAQPSCQRLSPCSAGRCHTTPQPPPSTALSRHVSGCHPAVQVDVIPHHNPRQALLPAVMSAAAALQCRQMSYHTTTPPPNTALSRHVSGCRPAVQVDVIPHHNPAEDHDRGAR